MPAVGPKNVFAVWLRGVLGAVGLALLSLGTAAVFVTGNEAGTASLLAAGLVAVLLCLLGRMPASVKVGTVEILMTEAVKAEDAGNVEAAEALKSVAEEVTREATGPPARSARLNAPDYEYAVLKVLSTVIGPDARVALEAVPDRGAVDAIVYQGNRGVAVEVRAGTSFRARDLIPRLDMAFRQEALGLTAMLVVIQAENNDPALESFRTAVGSLGVPARVVGWLPHASSETLAASVRELLTV